MRKPIAIAAMPEAHDTLGMMMALCDDGTIWGRSASGGEWVRMSDIPQEPEYYNEEQS